MDLHLGISLWGSRIRMNRRVLPRLIVLILDELNRAQALLEEWGHLPLVNGRRNGVICHMLRICHRSVWRRIDESPGR